MNTNPVLPSVPNMHPENVVPQSIITESPLDQGNINKQDQFVSDQTLATPSVETIATPVEDVSMKIDDAVVAAVATPTGSNLAPAELVSSLVPISTPLLSDQKKKLDPGVITKIIGEIVDQNPNNLDLTGLSALQRKVSEASSFEAGE